MEWVYDTEIQSGTVLYLEKKLSIILFRCQAVGWNPASFSEEGALFYREVLQTSYL